MKKLVVGIIAIVVLVGAFIGGAYAGGKYWVGKVINIQNESLCEMGLNEEREYYIWNEDGNTCLGEFVLKRTH